MDSREVIRGELHRAGLKVTPGRAALLGLLAKEAKPMDVSMILDKLSAGVDQATVYRSLKSLVKAGLIRPVSLKSGVSHYESASRPHHHHLICVKCGLVEDVTACCEDPEPLAASFSQVIHHNLEYSGICNDCAE